MNVKETIEMLKSFHSRILKSNLAREITEKEMLAILCAIDNISEISQIVSEIFSEIHQLKTTKWDCNDYVEWDAIEEIKKEWENKKCLD